jgi:hypothetical protein
MIDFGLMASLNLGYSKGEDTGDLNNVDTGNRLDQTWICIFI